MTAPTVGTIIDVDWVDLHPSGRWVFRTDRMVVESSRPEGVVLRFADGLGLLWLRAGEILAAREVVG